MVCTVLRCRWLIQDHLIQRPARLDTPRRSPRERLALARLAPRCRRCADLRRHPRTQHPHTRSAPAVHLLWLVFNLLFPKMSTYTHTKSARINSHVTAAEESALAGFFGQKNSHSLRRALSSNSQSFFATRLVTRVLSPTARASLVQHLWAPPVGSSSFSLSSVQDSAGAQGK